MGQSVIKELTLIGTPFDRGLYYGKECSQAIRCSMNSYARRFNGVGLTWKQAREVAKSFIPEIEKADVDYIEEMKGIAQGAEVDFEDILAINCRTELIYAPVAPQECTAFSLIPPATADAKVLAGQNWDYTRSQREALVVLRYPAQDGKPAIIFFAEAGMIGGKGMNSAGLGLTLNALQTSEGGKGLPLHVRMRRILEQNNMEAGFGVAASMPHPSPANLILTHKDGIALDVELDPSGFDVIQPQKGRIFHTNHFLGHKFCHRVRQQANTYIRLQRMETLLGACDDVSIDDVKKALSDHAGYPFSICEHVHPDRPGELMHQGATNHALIMDLSTGEAHFALGNPCESQYITFTL